MSLAERYDGFLIDLDGVVWLGPRLIPGAAETIRSLAAAGKPFAFVTNSPRLSPAEQAQRLRELGVPARDEQLVTAGAALIDLALERLAPGAPVLVTGTESFRSEVAAAGFELVDPTEWKQTEAVLVTGHERFSYDELKVASMAARAGALLAATGRDPTMPMPDGLWPGTGAILAAIETASGRTAITVGKPESRIFRSGVAALDVPEGSTVAMIGDRIDTDIAGAHRAGLDGILVAGNDSSTSSDGTVPEHRIGSLADLVG